MTPAELRRKAAELRGKIKQLVDAAETENRELTEDENATANDLRSQAEALERRAKLQDDLFAVPPPPPEPEGRRSPPVESERIEGGQSEEDKRHSLGDFLTQIKNVADNQLDSRSRERAHELLTNQYRSSYRPAQEDKRAMSSVAGAAGGWLMPQAIHKEIMKDVGEQAIVRPRARKIPMGAMSIPVPLLDQTGSPPTDGSSYQGGITLKWTGEAEAKPDTQPAFEQAQLEAKELSGTCKVPNILMQMSVESIDPLIRGLFAEAVAWMEDFAFFRADRPTRPKGIHSSPCVVTSTGRGGSGAITLADVIKVWTRVSMNSRTNGVFVASQAAESAVLNMTGSNNTVMIPAGFVPTTAEGASGFNLGVMNRPVLISEKLPALNTLGDFGFYDFSRYLLGEPPLTMGVALSTERYFEENVTAFRLLHYVAGMPWPKGPVTLADGSTTVSPFVLLGTA
jgi:HK97 family phage major capsid protein